MTMRLLRAIVLALLAVLFAACTTLGIQAPQTFNQRAVAAHNTVTAIATSALTLRTAGKLSDADRDNVVQTLRTAEAGIDLATLTAKTDPTAGADKLSASIAVLTALQTYLATKGAK
jgi:hypothetical protein